MAQAIPSYQDLYGGEYLNPVDLSGKVVRVMFTKAEVLELRCQNQKNHKIVLSAKLENGTPCKKKVAVNKTSAKQLAVAWGVPDTKAGCKCWLGKRADLSHAKVQAFGKLADCVLITPVDDAKAVPVVHDEDDLTPPPGPVPDESELREHDHEA